MAIAFRIVQLCASVLSSRSFLMCFSSRFTSSSQCLARSFLRSSCVLRAFFVCRCAFVLWCSRAFVRCAVVSPPVRLCSTFSVRCDGKSCGTAGSCEVVLSVRIGLDVVRGVLFARCASPGRSCRVGLARRSNAPGEFCDSLLLREVGTIPLHGLRVRSATKSRPRGLLAYAFAC